MQIEQKSIRIIDYEQQHILIRETPEAFEAYVAELINHISNNDSVREYKTRSTETEVIGSILNLCANQADGNSVSLKMDGVASRLLLKEIVAQERIARTRTNVQKGSLIQALLFNEDSNNYSYLLAKIEHSEWVDDADFTFKTGFSKDKKTIWKSCLFDLPDLNATEFYAKIYSNTVAKYWNDDFLELNEMTSDESNTTRAFKAIDATLNQNFRGKSSPDHTIIRNGFISYLKNKNHVDFSTMVDAVLENYAPVDSDIKPEKIQEIRAKLLEQPRKRNFDSQFSPVNSAINARVKKVYNINDGIDLKISGDIEDLSGTIRAIEENGVRYIRVRTNNDTTFRKFHY
ncbi:nucleoid-associated protein [Anaerospora sp.]|uniref:nucleoid-associated protein n=1 Tax=Anaerospora sp. TaxID=1960278 RepID=UPI0028979893|nr:nucleoid-associated protein [Anaerospora sp.]